MKRLTTPRSTDGHFTEFVDEARIIPYDAGNGQKIDVHGWVSLYGALDGGTYLSKYTRVGLNCGESRRQ